ncbi:hypothetical protein D9613_009742 [Agrocybe pediades]|uniref:Uncharacterized protein n=1 Tax=Agrocybe pediades TaxID=84607 RepID=A0A8H4QY82_9AGAR|nr:hypothetical protein D9613_009742 [Agrocybe pediades]
MTLSPGTYEIHSSKTHYATGTGAEDFVRALPHGAGSVNQTWRVVLVEEEDNVYNILPSLPVPPVAFAIIGGVRAGGPISLSMPPTQFYITPKDENKHIYVITPKGGPIGVKLVVVVEERDNVPTLVVDPFPIDRDVEDLPGWVFTEVDS